MTIILEIKEDKHSDFFIDLISQLDYVNLIKTIKDKSKKQFIQDLNNAFQEVKSHEQGKLKLKSAQVFLNEL